MSENPKRLIGAREVAEKMHIGRTKAYELIREQMVVFSSANTMESLMGIVKAECVHARTYATREEAALDLFEYIEVVYNRARTHSALATSAPPSSKRPIGPRKTAARRRRKNCQWNRGRSRFNPPHTHIVSDLTYVRVGGKWNYVCLLVDLHNREIVGHAASGRKDARLVRPPSPRWGSRRRTSTCSARIAAASSRTPASTTCWRRSISGGPSPARATRTITRSSSPPTES